MILLGEYNFIFFLSQIDAFFKSSDNSKMLYKSFLLHSLCFFFMILFFLLAYEIDNIF